MQKLLIVDGNSMLHRAYYALPDWRNRSGEATSGVYGFLSMLIKAIEELTPSHLVIVFDHPGPNFRHLMYVGYQSNREKDRQVAEDIWGQIVKLSEVFSMLNVPVYQIEGYEADDLVGTICNKTELEVVAITGDKDYMQLVNERVSLYMPKKSLSDGQIVDREQVKAMLGVWPEQVVDYKALAGDSSDNYPGVIGIGPKTAVSLLEEHQSFENIYKNLGKISESVRKKLVDGYEGGELSKRLAKIKTDVDVSFDIEKCVIPLKDEFVEKFRLMGYKSLVYRMTGSKEEVKVNSDQINIFERIDEKQ